jgi:hypothetical protein
MASVHGDETLPLPDLPYRLRAGQACRSDLLEARAGSREPAHPANGGLHPGLDDFRGQGMTQIGLQIGTNSGSPIGESINSTLYGQEYRRLLDSLAISGFAL